MRANYQEGNYGYGQAKQAFFELLLEKFGAEIEKYNYYMQHLDEIDKVLLSGAEKAHEVADRVLGRVRNKLGF
jgi:tryptophanyl-tRNA synthetase